MGHTGGAGGLRTPLVTYLRTGNLGLLEPLGDLDNISEGSTQLLPDWCQDIPDGRWGGRPGEPLDDPIALQLAKTVRQHLRRDSLDISLKLGEAALAFPKIPDHICCPSARQQTHAL